MGRQRCRGPGESGSSVGFSGEGSSRLEGPAVVPEGDGLNCFRNNIEPPLHERRCEERTLENCASLRHPHGYFFLLHFSVTGLQGLSRRAGWWTAELLVCGLQDWRGQTAASSPHQGGQGRVCRLRLWFAGPGTPAPLGFRLCPHE